METTDFLRDSFKRLHASLENVTGELTSEQLNFTPDAEHHSIAWVLWHAFRTEDLVVSRVLRGTEDRWSQGGWAQRFGLPQAGQGTGHSPEEAQAIHIDDLAPFMEYARGVAADVDAYLAGLSPADLEALKPWRAASGGQEPVSAIVGNHVMTHIYGHRNEIYWLRSLQGLKGSPN